MKTENKKTENKKGIPWLDVIFICSIIIAFTAPFWAIANNIKNFKPLTFETYKVSNGTFNIPYGTNVNIETSKDGANITIIKHVDK